MTPIPLTIWRSISDLVSPRQFDTDVMYLISNPGDARLSHDRFSDLIKTRERNSSKKREFKALGLVGTFEESAANILHFHNFAMIRFCTYNELQGDIVGTYGYVQAQIRAKL